MSDSVESLGVNEDSRFKLPVAISKEVASAKNTAIVEGIRAAMVGTAGAALLAFVFSIGLGKRSKPAQDVAMPSAKSTEDRG